MLLQLLPLRFGPLGLLLVVGFHGFDAASVLELTNGLVGSTDDLLAFLDVCPIRIGDYTLFGPAVQIYTPMHPFDAALRRKEEFGKPVEVGSDVWVGGGAIILPGVRIGSHAVIGAGSVVTRDVPDGVFAAGNPCRVIRAITE